MTILERAIETYGEDMQLNVAIEEFSELIKEICKHKRGEDNLDNIIEEMADCYIMMKQLEIIFDIKIDQISAKANQKMVRLERRLAEKENKNANAKEVGKLEKVGYSPHDCETIYRCPHCKRTFGDWSLFGQQGEKIFCPLCKIEVEYPY